MKSECSSIKKWCASVGISERTFYNLDKRGEAPPTVRIGRRRLVKHDTGERWLKAREIA